jgi:hypothetical protein
VFNFGKSFYFKYGLAKPRDAIKMGLKRNECSACVGAGYVRCEVCKGWGQTESGSCTRCCGKGLLKCPVCGGSGFVRLPKQA